MHVLIFYFFRLTIIPIHQPCIIFHVFFTSSILSSFNFIVYFFFVFIHFLTYLFLSLSVSIFYFHPFPLLSFPSSFYTSSIFSIFIHFLIHLLYFHPLPLLSFSSSFFISPSSLRPLIRLPSSSLHSLSTILFTPLLTLLHRSTFSSLPFKHQRYISGAGQ